MMRPGSPAGVCECGEPLEWTDGRTMHVGPGAASHYVWASRIRREGMRRVVDAVTLILLALALLWLVLGLAGCTATARRQAGSDAVEGGVAWLTSPEGERRVDAVGSRIGEAAGRGAALGARAEAGAVPWWQWVALALAAALPTFGATLAARAIVREVRAVGRGLDRRASGG